MALTGDAIERLLGDLANHGRPDGLAQAPLVLLDLGPDPDAVIGPANERGQLVRNIRAPFEEGHRQAG